MRKPKATQEWILTTHPDDTMFYKLSAPHVSFREYMYEGNFVTMPLVVLIACVVKLFRIPLPGSPDIPAAESLHPFRAAEETVDPEILHAITDKDRQLQDLGFNRIDFLAMNDRVNNTRYGGAVYRSADGETVAWIRYRLWQNLEKRNRFARLSLYSLGPSGEVIVTTSATRDLLDPPDWNVEYHPKIEAGELCDHHQQHVRRVMGSTRPMIASDDETAFELLEHTHNEFVAFQVDRGAFKETDATTSIANDTPVAELIGEQSSDLSEDVAGDVQPLDELQPMIDAVRKQETKQSGWFSKLVILGISIAFFIGLGALQWELKLVLILVPILFVHELGHYVAMKVFGYKNIHMFFIPLLGAAVSGRHYRVSGWKKAIVALAGPLPSIALGLGLGGVGWWMNDDTCMKGALITLILNVLNLAPFLPLDGGQVAHITLFSRSNVLDLMFRLVTVGLLMLVAALLGSKFLFFLGIGMVVGLPTVWRTMQITETLRNRGLSMPTDDNMPVDAIREIVDEIGRSNLPTHGLPTLAKLTLSIYENVMIRPPSWPATLGVWTLYLGGLFAGATGMLAITLAPHVEDWMDDVVPEFESHYELVDTDDGQFRLGKADADIETAKSDLLAWRFGDSESASAAFSKLADNGDDSVSRLGDFVFTSKPAEQGNVPNFEDGFAAQMESVERLASGDPRLDVLDDATWRRSFSHALPSLIVAVPDDLAETITSIPESLPQNIGDFAPIAPWTPKAELSDQQLDLRQRLRVLQGQTDEPPWEVVMPVPRDGEVSAKEDFRKSMREAAKRFEQTQANRLKWISEQAEATSGDEQRLYTAYLQYTTSLNEWSGDKRSVKQKGAAPQLLTYLQPLLPQLGYLHEQHPMIATSVNLDAFVLEPETEGESFTASFPIPYEDQSIVIMNLYPTRDSAAAYACVHAWLKKQGVKTVVWSYSTIKDVD